MENTSALYKQEMVKDLRGETKVNLKLGIIDTDAVVTISELTASDNIFFSSPQTIIHENFSRQAYATLEPKRIKAEGTQLVLPRESPIEQGYVSNNMSDTNCVYAVPPTIFISFSKTHTVKALSFIFDAATGDYPGEMLIEAWHGAQKLISETAKPTSYDFVSSEAIQGFDSLKLTFKKSNKPFRRARLNQITFGIGLFIRPENLTQLVQSTEVDPLSRRLPKQALAFTLENSGRMYDPDNPRGFWELIDGQTPIWIEYNQKIQTGMVWGDLKAQKWETPELFIWRQILKGGYTENIKGGRYYLTSQPQSDALSSNFTASTILERMSEKYVFGRYERNNLFALAEAVLNAADLPLLDKGQQPWKLWEGLKKIYTDAPLPNKSGAECLQIIANAAQCCLFVDRDGYIRIAPLDNIQKDFALDAETQIGESKIEKTATVKAVNCKYFTYHVSDEASELLNTNFNVSGTSSLFLEFTSPAVDISVQVSGATQTHESYAYGVRLNLTGNGRADVIINGKVLTSTVTNTYTYIKGADENGSIKTIENPLITDSINARAVGKWVSEYVQNRNTYIFAYRGSPELDVLDTVHSESVFTRDFKALVLSNEIKYDGTLLGTAVVKRS